MYELTLLKRGRRDHRAQRNPEAIKNRVLKFAIWGLKYWHHKWISDACRLLGSKFGPQVCLNEVHIKNNLRENSAVFENQALSVLGQVICQVNLQLCHSQLVLLMH